MGSQSSLLTVGYKYLGPIRGLLTLVFSSNGTLPEAKCTVGITIGFLYERLQYSCRNVPESWEKNNTFHTIQRNNYYFHP